MAKLRINGDSSGYVDLEAPNAASSSTLDLDQVPQKNATTTGFTGNMGVGISTPSTTDGGYNGGNLHVHNSGTGSSLRLTNSTTGTGTSSGMLISKWSDSNTYLTNFDNGANTIFTQSNSSGTLQTTMKLHGDGYVTKPQQPSFIARTNSTFNYTGGTGYATITNFGNVILNRSNSYNGSTGTFTAPVTGHYHFNFQLLLSNVATGDDSIHITFVQNSTQQIYANVRSPGSAANGVVGYGQYLPVIGVADMYMAANDTLKLQLSSSGTMNIYAGADWGRFSGHLIG